MTRIEEWADRVTREMLNAYWTEPCDDLTLAATNARLVLQREARALVTGAVNWQAERSAMDPTDEPNAGDWLDYIATPTAEATMTPGQMTLVELLEAESTGAYCYHDDAWRVEFKRRARIVREAIADANPEDDACYWLSRINAPDEMSAPPRCDLRSDCPVACNEAGRCLAVAPPPSPPPCATWCGTVWDSHGHEGSEIPYQDEPKRVRMTRCYCTPACRDAGKCLNRP